MTFEEFWKENYEKGLGTSEPYYGIASYAFEKGQENCNCVYTDNSKVIKKLEGENKRLRYELSLTHGNKGICLEVDGKNMTDVYLLQQELSKKDTIINFLKKELIHKTSYRNAMKKQYIELKQKYESLLVKHNPVNSRFADFVEEIKNDQ